MQEESERMMTTGIIGSEPAGNNGNRGGNRTGIRPGHPLGGPAEPTVVRNTGKREQGRVQNERPRGGFAAGMESTG